MCVKRGNVFPLELERTAVGDAAAGAAGAREGAQTGAGDEGSLAARTPEEADVVDVDVDVGMEQEGEEEQGPEQEGPGAREEQGGGGDEGPERKRVRL